MQRNGFYTHPENILRSMLADDDKSLRERAVTKILAMRQADSMKKIEKKDKEEAKKDKEEEEEEEEEEDGEEEDEEEETKETMKLMVTLSERKNKHINLKNLSRK